MELSAGQRMKVKYRTLALTHYGGEYICCGEIELAFLVLDHIYDDGAYHRRIISQGGPRGGAGYTLYRWLYVRGWPEIVQVLCANCNTAKSRTGGCPHGTTLSPLVLDAKALDRVYRSKPTIIDYGVDKTHCSNGHKRTPANTAFKPNGKAYCKVCNRDRARVHRQNRQMNR